MKNIKFQGKIQVARGGLVQPMEQVTVDYEYWPQRHVFMACGRILIASDIHAHHHDASCMIKRREPPEKY